MTDKKRSNPRGNAGRAYSQEQNLPLTTQPAESPDFATWYVSRRYQLPLALAAVVVTLASFGRAIG